MSKPALDLSALTANEKFELIDDLWRSLSDNDLALSPAMCAELDRRIERLDGDSTSGIAWEEVDAEMAGEES